MSGRLRGLTGLSPAALLVVPAMLAGNAVSWLFTVVVARQLGPASYGALVGLLAVVFALAAPGMAMQVVVARRVAVCRRAGGDADAVAAAVVRLALVLGAAPALLALAAAPLVAAYLHLDSLGQPAWLAANLALLPPLFAVGGLLQGRERFGALTAVLLLAAAGKLPLGVALVAAGWGVEGALAGVAAGALAATLLGLAVGGAGRRRGPAAAAETRGLGAELVAAAAGMLGLVVLTNLDVLLARHYLPVTASGLYAAGSVVAKVAYWAPLGGLMVAFPRLTADTGRRALLRQVTLATLGFGALCTAAAAVLAAWPALLPFGRAYAAVGPDLTLFAALGTTFALVQLLLFSGIAAGRRRGAWPVGMAAAGQALLVALHFHHSVTQIVTVALATSTLPLLVALGRPSLGAHRGGRPVTISRPRPARTRTPERAGRRQRPTRRVGEPLAYLLLGLALALAVVLPSWGQPSIDTSPRLYFEPGRTLAGAFSAWTPAPSLGQQNYNVGIAPVAAAVWAIRTVTGSLWLTTRLWRLLLLVVAAAGAARLFHRLAGDRAGAAGRVAAAIAYAVNPYVLVAGSTNPILLPYALLPWLLLALATSVRAPRSWRPPAAFAAVFFAMSGVNAGVVPLIMLLAVPCYLAYARLADGAAWRALVAATARCGLLALALSLYWLVPSLLAGGVGASVAVFTESPEAVAATSSWTESLRLLGFWVLYGRSGPHPWMPSFVALLTNPLVVAASFALPLAALLSACWSRARLRALAAILLAVGVTAMVGMYPPDRPAPLGRLLAWSFRHVPGALAFRTTNKAGALAALGTALLLAAGAAEAARRLAGRRAWWRVAAALAALAVLAVAVLPAWAGAASPNLVALPAYWRQAVRDLDASARGSRVLLLPGEANAIYRWGDLGPEDVNQALFSRGTAVRMSFIPGASLAQANYLAALTVPLQHDWAPGAVATMARYLGTGDVLLRNDLAWERAGGAHPSTLTARLDREPGLLPAGSYGRPGEHTVRPTVDRQVPTYGEPPGADDLDAELPPLQRYLVQQPQAVLRAEPAVGTVLVDGDNFAVPALARAGLLRGQPPFRLLGDMSAEQLGTALRDGARIVLTDTNRRRLWTTSRVGASYSPTMAASDPLPPDQPTLSLFGAKEQSVVALEGAARITATGPVGSIFGKRPADKPAFAYDGDPATAWTTGDFGTAVGRSLILELPQPRVLSQVTLRPAATEPQRVAAAAVHVGDRVVAVTMPQDLARTPQVTVRFPPTRSSTLRVEITAVTGGAGDNPVGFAEVAVPGVRVREHETVRLPRRFRELADRLLAAGDDQLLARTPLDVVLQRQGSRQQPFLDEERVLDREFWLPDRRRFALSGNLARGPDLPDQTIDQLVGGMPAGVEARSSSRWFGDEAARASRAIDGDPTTGWSPATSRPGEWLELRFPPRRVDQVTIQQPQTDELIGNRLLGYASEVELSLDGGRPLHYRLQPGSSQLVLPPRVARRLRLTVRGAGGFGEQLRVSEVQLGGVRAPRTSRATRLAGCVTVATLDGRPLRARLEGTLGQAEVLPLRPCGAARLALGPGLHRLRSLPGWRFDDLRLASPGSPAPVSTPRPPPPAGRVWSSSRTAVTVHTTAAHGPWYLVLGQGFDPRWSATIDGRPLGPPLLLDGYSVGWRVEAPGPHEITIAYGPQRAATAAGLASLAALVVVLMLLVGRARRSA